MRHLFASILLFFTINVGAQSIETLALNNKKLGEIAPPEKHVYKLNLKANQFCYDHARWC
jgi:hypothetical protein